MVALSCYPHKVIRPVPVVPSWLNQDPAELGIPGLGDTAPGKFPTAEEVAGHEPDEAREGGATRSSGNRRPLARR